MLRSLGLALVLLCAAGTAWAQQPDPAQAFAKEWGTLQAADTLSAASHEHVAELAQKLVADYQRVKQEAAEKTKALSESDSHLQWVLDNWVAKNSP